MPSKKQSTADETPLSFEEALSELTEIVGELEDGSVGLEESMVRFEQGMSLLQHCRHVLEAAEQRIEQLTGFDADGNEETTPFEATATIDERPRTAGRGKSPRADDAEESDDEQGTDVGPRLF